MIEINKRMCDFKGNRLLFSIRELMDKTIQFININTTLKTTCRLDDGIWADYSFQPSLNLGNALARFSIGYSASLISKDRSVIGI